jgi:hypothetical protein
MSGLFLREEKLTFVIDDGGKMNFSNDYSSNCSFRSEQWGSSAHQYTPYTYFLPSQAEVPPIPLMDPMGDH